MRTPLNNASVYLPLKLRSLPAACGDARLILVAKGIHGVILDAGCDLSNMNTMDRITASAAKQNFGQLPARAATAPVGIERRGKLVAALVPPQWLAQSSLMDERRRAREDQQRVEQRRLMAHQRIGIELLGHKVRRKQLLDGARREVRRWFEEGLCSSDYIERWNEWLALPTIDLVDRMCSDAEGWGAAMRQNSPVAAALR